MLLTLMSLASAGELESAYQREFAYLKAEKTSLQAAQSAQRQESEERLSAAEGEADSLQGLLIRRTLEADRMDQALEQAERASFSAQEDADRVGALLMQARTTLVGVELPEQVSGAQAEAQALTLVFAGAAERIRRGAQVRVEAGEFFVADGAQVSGQVVSLGNIASYGVTPDHAGALAPAGEDRLQLWPTPAQDAARALAAGALPSTLPVFLYEDLSKRMEEHPDKTLGQVLEGGGLVGWIILALGVVAVLIAGLRLLLLRGAGSPQALADAVCRAWEEQDLEGALKMAGEDSAAGRVAHAVLAARGLSRVQIEDLASEALLREAPRLERLGPAILIIAAVAPLLGLLGTVTGMISTFDIITEFGTGDPKMLSGGISTALITTQLGLVVAIPAVLLGNAISGKTEAVLSELDRAALQLVNTVDAAEVRGA